MLCEIRKGELTLVHELEKQTLRDVRYLATSYIE